ncbi:ABC transporter ATP-binding protein [Moraxella marmotae]|uniref:ABC transporter ATP-binding protein n=1 Tax=Moraxella marmotae TaxID=3344520 RepID=UPI0035F240BC
MTDLTTLLSFDNLSFYQNNSQHTDTAHRQSAVPKQLLHAASGKLNTGDKVVLMGQSGAGKSVLLSALAGQIAHQGQICLHLPSKPLTQSDTPAPLWREKVALLTQTPVMIDGTVLDNLALPYRFVRHKAKSFCQAWHIAQLTAFGKDADFIKQEIHTLSGGERQLVHFLRTLQLQPNVLLLDEPTAALDTKTAQALIDCINHWVSDTPHRAVIWVSHHPDEQHQLSAKRWTMHAGKLTTDGTDAINLKETV